ncbi:MAG: aminotransferase class I/II-fold pyridoxal phosphate-dependent enzyme, partial [Acidimicrobiales bacterium]|nr:aminotransferase class I/II-fold pyridoxal phosphate-dependent enzyme [Acidimicrobiales bacterium]
AATAGGGEAHGDEVDTGQGGGLRAEVDGVVAVHSLSKRSNLAGVRVGFYAGDPALVHYLREVRKHAGFMVPGPAQAAAAAALADQDHVAEQRERYRNRLERLARIVGRFGPEPALPRGGFYLWAAAPDGDAWAFTRTLLTEVGILVSPGEFYGSAAADRVRVAAVLTDDALDMVESRLS